MLHKRTSCRYFIRYCTKYTPNKSSLHKLSWVNNSHRKWLPLPFFFRCMLFNVSLGVKQRVRGRNFTNEYLFVASCFLVFCGNARKKALKNFAKGLQVDFSKFKRLRVQGRRQFLNIQHFVQKTLILSLAFSKN